MKKYKKKWKAHIRLVKTQATLDGKDFDGEEIKPMVIVMAKVREVTKHGHELYTPLIPLPTPVHLLATICYDLNKFGLSWREIRDHYHLPPEWTRERVRNYIQVHGRCIETEESFSSPVGLKGGIKTEITRMKNRKKRFFIEEFGITPKFLKKIKNGKVRV